LLTFPNTPNPKRDLIKLFNENREPNQVSKQLFYQQIRNPINPPYKLAELLTRFNNTVLDPVLTQERIVAHSKVSSCLAATQLIGSLGFGLFGGYKPLNAAACPPDILRHRLAAETSSFASL
jgi:hypothetical protein